MDKKDINDMIDFHKKYGRYPRKYSNGEQNERELSWTEVRLRYLFNTNDHNLTSEIYNQITEYDPKFFMTDKVLIEDAKDIVAWCNLFKRHPKVTQQNEEERRLAFTYIKLQKDFEEKNPDICIEAVDILLDYDPKFLLTKEERMQKQSISAAKRLIGWINEKGFLPREKAPFWEMSLYQSMKYFEPGGKYFFPGAIRMLLDNNIIFI